jgi:hypothetical protein
MIAKKPDNGGEQGDRRCKPLLDKLPASLAIPVLVLSLVTPFVWAVLAHRQPLAGIIGAPLAIVAYFKMRYGGRGFGPLWLELVDMIVVLGNLGSFALSCVVAGRTWF